MLRLTGVTREFHIGAEIARAQDRAVVVVTHNQAEAAVTDRVITLRDGRIRLDPPTAN